MKNVQKATVGIVLTSVALIFSIFGLLMTNGTLAWFTGNKENARRKKPEFVFEKVLDFLSLL